MPFTTPLRRGFPLGLPLALALASALPLALASVPALAAGPFDGFAGRWTGSGTVLAGGRREPIRCSARYTPTADGRGLGIAVTCASDSYKIALLSQVAARGDAFSGSWQETTRGLSGDVSGRIPAPGTFEASLEALGGGLQLGARTDGRRQAITVTAQGGDIQGASISLVRR